MCGDVCAQRVLLFDVAFVEVQEAALLPTQNRFLDGVEELGTSLGELGSDEDAGWFDRNRCRRCVVGGVWLVGGRS